MDKTTKWVLGLIVALIVIGGVYALAKNKDDRGGSDSGAAVKTDGPYKIGVLVPLTGDAASYGEAARNVYQIALEEINKSGGVDGEQLELVVEDAKCNGKDAASAAQKLVNVDKVQIILGGFCSGESLAAIPVAEAGKVVMLSAGSSSPDLTGKSKYFFRNYPSDATQGTALAQLAKDMNWKKVAFIQEQTDYAVGIYKAFDAKHKENGGTIVKEEFATATTDVRSQLTKLKGENPDALFIDTQTPASGERVIKQLQDMQWQPKLMTSDIIVGEVKLLDTYKTFLEGAFGAEFGTDPGNAKFAALQKMYKEKHNANLPFQSYGQTEYDALFIIRDAIKAVGYNGEKIATWSRTIKNWAGASGMTTIGQDGDRVGGHQVEIVKNGKVEKYQK